MLAVILFTGIRSYGQAAQFKAMYLYKFAKGVSWPSDAATNAEFTITIVGDNEMATALKKTMGSRKIGNRSVVILEAATVAQIKKSDVIFLGESKSDQIQKLMDSQKGNHVLIVAGKSGWCEHGASISFVNKNGALAYEVSAKNIQHFGLSCSQELIRSGINVD